jgi:hypothetical protein
LSQDRAALVVHGRQQMRRAAVAACRTGAAHGLAVDGHRSPPAGRPTLRLLVGQPGADHPGQGVGVQPRQRAADGGLGGDTKAAGGLLAGAERGPHLLGCIGGPLGDRGDRPRPGQHRGGCHGQDRQQRVAAATGGPGVGHGGQVGQQVRGFGLFELVGIGVGELGERGWDRG